MTKRNVFAATLILPLLLIAAFGLAETNSGDITENGGSAAYYSGIAVGTCSDGSVMLDSNGVTFCGSSTTTDPSAGYINGPDCSSSPTQDPTCTAAPLVLSGGLDFKGVTCTAANSDPGETITVVVCTNAQTCTTTTLTDGTEFVSTGTNAACATSLATAIRAIAGVASASATGAIASMQANRSTSPLIYFGTASDATGLVIDNGTESRVLMHSGLEFSSGAAERSTYLMTAGDTDSGIAAVSGAGGAWSLYVNGNGISVGASGIGLNTAVTSNNVFTGTQDIRNAISNSTGNLSLYDVTEVGSTLYVRHATAAIASFGVVGTQYFGVNSTAPHVNVLSTQTFSYPHWGVTATTGAILPLESGRSENNTGAVARADRTLPDVPLAGYIYRAFVNNANGIKIIANTGDTIYVAGIASAVAGYICNLTIGTSVTCEAVSTTDWFCHTNGVWLVDTGCA